VSSAPEPEYVRPRQRLDGQVVLAEPDPQWPQWYAGEEAKIRVALGDRARVVEHVGSTSVPGLAAKPVIDVVLAVDDPRDEAAYVGALEAAGYLLAIRERGWHEHRLFKGAEPVVNLHVFAVGDTEVERMVRFRDHLRAHPDDRALYERTKRELAARTWAIVQDYADAKSDVVEEINARAGAPARMP
jgi:GrpB-like predicted nucleotidyltransferase (UPF0157 family)